MRVDTTGGSTRDSGWFQDEADKAAAAKANSFQNAGYKSFMNGRSKQSEQTYGELRDTNGDAGASGPYYERRRSADGGYSDNYTHVQVGFDKNTRWTVDLFTGKYDDSLYRQQCRQ